MRVAQSEDMSPSDDIPLADLLDRYLAGACTADEHQHVAQYLAEHPVVQHRLDALRVALGSESPEPTPYAAIRPTLLARLDVFSAESTSATRTTTTIDPDHVPMPTDAMSSAHRVSPSVKSATHRGRVPSAFPMSSSRFARWLGAAATGAVLGVLGIAMIRGWSSTTNVVHTYATTTGQRATLTLVDGSRVTLAPGSTMTVTSDGRSVQLVGEAFFAIAPHMTTPFVVRTGTVRTRVLGTSFDVRHYPSDPHVRVVVATGKVQVEAMTHQHPSIILAAGAIGTVTDSTAQTIITSDVSSYTDWTNGHLVFDRAPVSDVLGTLERWYGYKFRLTDPQLRDRHVTTTLDYNAPTQALRKIELLLDVELGLDGDSVVLRPRTRSTRATPTERTRPSQLFPAMEVGR